jgi:hypothetical protein
MLSPGPAAAELPDCDAVNFQQACFSSADQTFPDTDLCDFPVHVQVTGWLRYRPFFADDGSGNLAGEELHRRFRATITNPVTARSFADSADINTRATYLPDGSVEVRETGLLHNVQVDTRQRIFHQSGKHSILVDPGGDVIQQLFRGNWEPEAAFPDEICPILAQPRM